MDSNKSKKHKEYKPQIHRVGLDLEKKLYRAFHKSPIWKRFKKDSVALRELVINATYGVNTTLNHVPKSREKFSHKVNVTGEIS